MAVERVGDMTLDELNNLIELAIDRRIESWLIPKESKNTTDILNFLDKHRITPSPNAKSALEMLREDRDA